MENKPEITLLHSTEATPEQMGAGVRKFVKEMTENEKLRAYRRNARKAYRNLQAAHERVCLQFREKEREHKNSIALWKELYESSRDYHQLRLAEAETNTDGFMSALRFVAVLAVGAFAFAAIIN
jgi:hypothetical protein